MTIYDSTWYLDSVNYAAVTPWAALTAYTVGQTRRQLATPAVNSERVFVCIVAGTSLAAEPTWNLTYGSKTAEAAGPTWMEVTGRAGVNGDITNAGTWVASRGYVLGQMIYDAVTSSIQIVTTSGTSKTGSPPSFSGTAGTTTTDNSATWTSLGAASSFAAWANPAARMQPPLSSGFMIAGNTLNVAHTHAETQASAITINGNNATFANPFNILCVNKSVAPPTTLATTASITTTGASSISFTSNCYMYGVNFNCGTGANNAQLLMTNQNTQAIFDTCGFNLLTTSVGQQLNCIDFPGRVNFTTNFFSNILLNCSITVSATTQLIGYSNNGPSFMMKNCLLFQTGSVPSPAFFFFANGGSCLIRDTDLSKITGTLFDVSVAITALVQNCKLASGVTINTANTIVAYAAVKIQNSDSAATNYRFYNYLEEGTVQQETTIVRTGGATDGVTPISWNLTTNANASFVLPLLLDEIEIYNTSVGSALTAALYLTTNTTLTNKDVWIEVEYPSSTLTPLGAYVTTQGPLIGSSTAIPTDTSTWGGSITNKYKITSPNFTPQMAGPIKMRVYAAKPSVTIYADPQIEGIGVTIGKSYFIPGWGYINEAASGAGASMLVHPGMTGGARG